MKGVLRDINPGLWFHSYPESSLSCVIPFLSGVLTILRAFFCSRYILVQRSWPCASSLAL